MRAHRAVVLVLLLLAGMHLGTGSAAAGPPQRGPAPEASQWLTLEDCLALGLKNNPGIKAALSREAVAQATLKLEKSRYLPTLGLQFSSGLTDSDFLNIEGVPVYTTRGGRTGTLALTQTRRLFYNYSGRMVMPLVGDGVLGFGSHKVAKATLAIQQTHFQLDAIKRDLITQITDLYQAAHKAQLDRRVYQEAVSHYQAILQLVREKFALHVASRKDVLLAEAGLAQAQADLAVSEHEYQRTAKQLFLLIGLPTSQRAQVKPLPPKLPLLPPWPQVEEKIPRSNLDLKAKRLDIDIAQEDLALSKNKLWPTLDFLVQAYGTDAEHRDYSNAYAGYVLLKFPLFEAPLYATIGVKKKQVNLASDNYRVTADSLIKNAMDIYKDLQDIRPKITSAQKQIAYLEENYRESKEKYRLNLISFIDLSNSLLSLLNAKKDLQDLYFNYQSGYRKLQDLMGDHPFPAGRGLSGAGGPDRLLSPADPRVLLSSRQGRPGVEPSRSSPFPAPRFR